MKITFGATLIFTAILMTIFQIHHGIVANYRYEKDYSNLWSLAEKSSSIPAKQKYIAEFVAKLKAGRASGEFSGYNAMWLKTPNNSFDSNLAALQTLSDRLSEIQGMNPNSFEYNTAIEQITKQEEWEAENLLDVFDGCYTLANYPTIWGWVQLVFILGILGVFVGGFLLVIIGKNES